jgi:structural maintenance of chromosome 4
MRRMDGLIVQMDIKQKIEDNQKIQKDSRDKHRHWLKRHDELELQFVEYVSEYR